MQVSHTIGSVVFFTAIAVISVSAIAYVVAWCSRKFQRQKEPERSGCAKWTRRGVLGLAGGGVGCIAWGGFFEPYRLDITRTRIVSQKLNGAERPVRIVQISDMHCDRKVRNEEKLPGVIKSLNPDVIVYTGDSINSLEGLANFRRCLTEIAKAAPTYVSKGNWDTYFGQTDFFGQTGATELNGANEPVEVAGTRIWLAGAGVMDMFQPHEASEFLDQAISGMPDDEFRVFLYHYPDLIYSLAERKIDLHLAGHTHGGQVALPFYGALVTVSKYGKKFEAGLYREHNTHLYVNRGIGMEGNAPRVRFWCPPEISLIELVPSQTPTTSQA